MVVKQVFKNGTAKWVITLIAFAGFVGTGVHQHTKATGRITSLEEWKLELSKSIEKIGDEVTEQGKLLAKIAGKLDVETEK